MVKGEDLAIRSRNICSSSFSFLGEKISFSNFKCNKEGREFVLITPFHPIATHLLVRWVDQVLWIISSTSKWAGVSSSWRDKHELPARWSAGAAWGVSNDSHTLASSLPPQKAHTTVTGDLPCKHPNPIQSQKICLVQVGQGWRLCLQLSTYLYFPFTQNWDSSERRIRKVWFNKSISINAW